MAAAFECPWVALREVVHLFGVTYETAKNRIYAQTFPVPVRREGKLLVIDKAVMAAYFEARRQQDLAKLKLPHVSPNG
ncbi:putative excisionase [Achromobacter phage vB_AchrS_AchV4]|uniref:Putative excisionase n=1 Tax=Achromobacter phage vB_AchrS_AchV4 TaxID=2796514 RepID=A0A7T3PGY2_9CAUD|nr:putative excisionase [Achromobacter phage vB_AchrS_AchV4]QPZ53302.1 putative excisionase [Achromobacter phage vB_AchrS_AchV4]